MTITRKARLLGLGCALLLALVACGGDGGGTTPSGDEPLKKVRFLLGFNPQGVHTPWYLGIEKGFFEEEGIDLEVVPGDAPAVALAGLDAEEAEFASVDIMGLALAQQSGEATDVRLLAMTYAQLPLTFFSLESGANVTEPEQLQGKTIHYTAGAPHPQILGPWLHDRGVDVKWKEIDPAVRDQLLLAGEVPVITGFLSNQPSMERALEDGDQLRAIEVAPNGLGDFYSSGVAARMSWLEENEDLAKAFVRAYLRSFEYAFDHPEEAAEVASQQFPELLPDVTVDSIAILEKLMTREGTVDRLGYIEPQIVESTLEHARQELKLSKVQPQDLYVDGYVP